MKYNFMGVILASSKKKVSVHSVYVRGTLQFLYSSHVTSAVQSG